MARRSRNFRRAVQRAARDSRAAGIRFESVSDGALWPRILAVERRSWKGLDGFGIDDEPMHGFYFEMLTRLQCRGRLRLTLAQRHGEDVGYIMGAIFAGRYRGLQFSFAADQSALGLGNAMQLFEIEQLAALGIGEYDLGTTGEHYKKRWSDREVPGTALVIIRK
jgi:hypothetical protein